MPEVEVDVDEALVRALVAEQGDAQLRAALDERLELVGRGWDNAVFRLGSELAVRVPVRELAVALIERESTYAAEALEPVVRSGVAVSVPVFRGEPGSGYPWPWLVVRWVDGESVAALPVERRGGLAEPLARALAVLHRPAHGSEPVNPWRGVPLADRDADVQARWPTVADRFGPEAAEVLRSTWEEGLGAPPWDRAPVWVHGDPHPLNLVHTGGSTLGLLDLGDIGVGDPACDVATAWMTFGSQDRLRFLALLHENGSYDTEVDVRAAAWAAQLAGAVVAAGHVDDELGAMARHVVGELEG